MTIKNLKPVIEIGSSIYTANVEKFNTFDNFPLS